MQQDTKDYISALADKFSGTYKYTEESILKMIYDFGGSVIPCSGFDPCDDGLVKKCGKDEFAIRVNPIWTEKDKKDTMIRGFAHTLIHLGFKQDDELWQLVKTGFFYRFNTTMQCEQADYFLSCFKLPKQAFMEIVEKYSHGDELDIFGAFSELNNINKCSFGEILRRAQELDVF